MRLPIRGDDNWSAFEGYDNILTGIYKGRGEERSQRHRSLFHLIVSVFLLLRGIKGKFLNCHHLRFLLVKVEKSLEEDESSW